MNRNMKMMTYGEIADRINDWLERLVPVHGPIWSVLKGQELFQQSRVDKLMEKAVEHLLGLGDMAELESKWIVVLRTRLTFARDLFLSRHQHPGGKEEKIKRSELARLLKKTLTDEWMIYGLEWLLLYRAGIPALAGCPDWRLCESSRWAMSEYGEYATWGYEPGALSQDPPIYTLEKLRTLVLDLAERMAPVDLPSELLPFYLEDVRAAAEPENAEDFAAVLCMMMKYPDFTVQSVYTIQRFYKRLLFAEDYLKKIKPAQPITKREAYATIAVICTTCWAACGETWLKKRAIHPHSFTMEDKRKLDSALAILEAPMILTYMNPYAELLLRGTARK